MQDKTFGLNFVNHRIDLKPSCCTNRLQPTFVTFCCVDRKSWNYPKTHFAAFQPPFLQRFCHLDLPKHTSRNRRNVQSFCDHVKEKKTAQAVRRNVPHWSATVFNFSYNKNNGDDIFWGEKKHIILCIKWCGLFWIMKGVCFHGECVGGGKKPVIFPCKIIVCTRANRPNCQKS